MGAAKKVADVPDLFAMWDASNPGRPEDTPLRHYRKVKWRCSKGHRFEALPRKMANDPRCPKCIEGPASLHDRYPGLGKFWHPQRNQALTPRDVDADATFDVWWQCEQGHGFSRSVLYMVKNQACPHCEKHQRSLQVEHPDVAQYWHVENNGEVSPDQVASDSMFDAWWFCPQGHEYRRSVRRRVAHQGQCPICYDNWPIEKIRNFVRSLSGHIQALSPAERYALAIQAGIFEGPRACQEFVKEFTSGKFPSEELEKFGRGEASQLDEAVAEYRERDFSLQPQVSEAVAKTLKGAGPYQFQKSAQSFESDSILDQSIAADVRLDEQMGEQDCFAYGAEGRPDAADQGKTHEQALPLVKTDQALAALDRALFANPDNETVRFLRESAKAKLWKHAYQNVDEARSQAQAYKPDTYSRSVVEDFLAELHAAENFKTPKGYRFRPSSSSKIVQPNLMQRHVALSVCRKRRFGNWSGMGAGKTLSAILATRCAGAKMTVIVCPNAVVSNWCKEIDGAFEGCQIQHKTWTPQWKKDRRPRYLVMNHEQFQLPKSTADGKDSETRLLDFLDTVSPKVDFVVIDEIHQTKMRSVEKMSRRRKLVQGLLVKAKEAIGEDLHVLGMSGTPVINNLQEGKSLIEMIDGYDHDELQTRATVQNCMKLHQWFITLGTRYRPDYETQLDESSRPQVSCEPYLDEIRTKANGTILEIEQILTQVRLPAIVDAIEPGEKALVYTHYVQGIVPILREGLTKAGHQVGVCIGGEGESELEAFKRKDGHVDVLIASSRIAVGVDGLQHVCNKLVVNILPWTSADYDQLKARLWRQGSRFNTVHVVVPITYANLKGGRWSYCESKLARLAYKQSIADAAVDGEVPQGNLRNETQAQADIMGWLERLDEEREYKLERHVVEVPLSRSPEAVMARVKSYGDFLKMNDRWYRAKSAITHKRLENNVEEWAHYHTMYREQRAQWSVIPFEEEIRWLAPGPVDRDIFCVGDFGCGEREISKQLHGKYQFFNLDHVAIDEQVIACDLANIPLDDETLQLAIFCLSMMGSNCTDYIRQAHRLLEPDGHLHLWEPISYFDDVNAFCDGLERLGFAVMRPQKVGKYYKIYARKNSEKSDPKLRVCLKREEVWRMGEKLL